MIHLEQRELDLVKKILRVFLPEGRKVMAFGSRVTGDKLKKHSDLDLCIMGLTPLTMREMSDLKDAFTNSNLPFRVDVIDWNETEPSFQEIIESHCEEIVF